MALVAVSEQTPGLPGRQHEGTSLRDHPEQAEPDHVHVDRCSVPFRARSDGTEVFVEAPASQAGVVAVVLEQWSSDNATITVRDGNGGPVIGVFNRSAMAAPDAMPAPLAAAGKTLSVIASGPGGSASVPAAMSAVLASVADAQEGVVANLTLEAPASCFPEASASEIRYVGTVVTGKTLPPGWAPGFFTPSVCLQGPCQLTNNTAPFGSVVRLAGASSSGTAVAVLPVTTALPAVNVSAVAIPVVNASSAESLVRPGAAFAPGCTVRLQQPAYAYLFCYSRSTFLWLVRTAPPPSSGLAGIVSGAFPFPVTAVSPGESMLSASGLHVETREALFHVQPDNGFALMQVATTSAVIAVGPSRHLPPPPPKSSELGSRVVRVDVPAGPAGGVVAAVDQDADLTFGYVCLNYTSGRNGVLAYATTSGRFRTGVTVWQPTEDAGCAASGLAGIMLGNVFELLAGDQGLALEAIRCRLTGGDQWASDECLGQQQLAQALPDGRSPVLYAGRQSNQNVTVLADCAKDDVKVFRVSDLVNGGGPAAVIPAGTRSFVSLLGPLVVETASTSSRSATLVTGAAGRRTHGLKGTALQPATGPAPSAWLGPYGVDFWYNFGRSTQAKKYSLRAFAGEYTFFFQTPQSHQLRITLEFSPIHSYWSAAGGIVPVNRTQGTKGITLSPELLTVVQGSTAHFSIGFGESNSNYLIQFKAQPEGYAGCINSPDRGA